MGKVVHIMTVGTSLLTNEGNLSKRALNDRNRVSIESLNKICNSAKGTLDNNIYPTQEQTEIIKILTSINPQHEIDLRKHRGNKGSDRLPQELSYLWIRKGLTNFPQEPEEIYLLSSNTTHAIFCANVIREYINNNVYLKNYYKVEEICCVDGIDPYEGERFKKEGIKKLFEVIHLLMIEPSNNNDRIYLNITGGYKGLVPYSTLQGMLYPSENVTICYLFEESPIIIEIPSYPVGVDFNLWHRNSTRLKMLCEHSVKAFRKNLDKKMTDLIDDNKLNAFGKQLKERYERQLKEQPLEIYTKEIVEKLLPDSLNNNAKEYRTILNNIIDRTGDNIWTGDKLPEMVEHAKRHHHNLLEFAEMFLTPIFEKNDKFLNAEERFCLLGGLLLHDCGHSIDYMKIKEYGIVPLFPSEIREYHHLLSAMRLEDPDLAKSLGWPEKNKFNTINSSSLHDAVMTVCRYHRRKMPFNENEEKFINPFTKEQFPPLFSKKDAYKSINVDIMKVVALMRIIDGCDIQITRLGSKEIIEITKELLNKDYESTKKRAEDAFNAYKDLCKILDDNTSNELKNGCKYIDDSNMKLSDNYMDFRIKCLDILKNDGNVNNKTLARLWLTAAELIDRADMKRKQEEHYLKHQCVKEVLIIPSDNFNNDNIFFDIVLIENDKVENRCLSEIVENDKTYKILIEENVRSEYEGIAEYLANNYKMYLKYWWKEEYDNRNNNGKFFYGYHG